MSSSKVILMIIVFAFILSYEGVYAKKHKYRSYFSYKPPEGTPPQTMAEKAPVAILILIVGLFLIAMYNSSVAIHEGRNYGRRNH